MYKLFINGKTYTAEEDKKLLPFLRDDLHLTAAKDGCSEGVCGTCTVLVDGQKMKACVLSLSKLEGKRITTVEGIPAEEMRVYEHCFAEAGAVQCGFCIPGMIISAKSLLDKNLNPTRSDVKQAIKGNLCRCTGYKKIEDAILMFCEISTDDQSFPLDSSETPVYNDERKEENEMKCNVCGQLLNNKTDYIEVKKEWGYFSNKDTQIHEFKICERCYDRIVKQFEISPKVTEKSEILS